MSETNKPPFNLFAENERSEDYVSQEEQKKLDAQSQMFYPEFSTKEQELNLTQNISTVADIKKNKPYTRPMQTKEQKAQITNNSMYRTNNKSQGPPLNRQELYTDRDVKDQNLTMSKVFVNKEDQKQMRPVLDNATLGINTVLKRLSPEDQKIALQRLADKKDINVYKQGSKYSLQDITEEVFNNLISTSALYILRHNISNIADIQTMLKGREVSENNDKITKAIMNFEMRAQQIKAEYNSLRDNTNPAQTEELFKVYDQINEAVDANNDIPRYSNKKRIGPIHRLETLKKTKLLNITNNRFIINYKSKNYVGREIHLQEYDGPIAAKKLKHNFTQGTIEREYLSAFSYLASEEDIDKMCNILNNNVYDSGSPISISKRLLQLAKVNLESMQNQQNINFHQDLLKINPHYASTARKDFTMREFIYDYEYDKQNTLDILFANDFDVIVTKHKVTFEKILDTTYIDPEGFMSIGMSINSNSKGMLGSNEKRNTTAFDEIAKAVNLFENILNTELSEEDRKAIWTVCTMKGKKENRSSEKLARTFNPSSMPAVIIIQWVMNIAFGHMKNINSGNNTNLIGITSKGGMMSNIISNLIKGPNGGHAEYCDNMYIKSNDKIFSLDCVKMEANLTETCMIGILRFAGKMVLDFEDYKKFEKMVDYMHMDGRQMIFSFDGKSLIVLGSGHLPSGLPGTAYLNQTMTTVFMKILTYLKIDLIDKNNKISDDAVLTSKQYGMKIEIERFTELIDVPTDTEMKIDFLGNSVVLIKSEQDHYIPVLEIDRMYKAVIFRKTPTSKPTEITDIISFLKFKNLAPQTFIHSEFCESLYQYTIHMAMKCKNMFADYAMNTEDFTTLYESMLDGKISQSMVAAELSTMVPITPFNYIMSVLPPSATSQMAKYMDTYTLKRLTMIDNDVDYSNLVFDVIRTIGFDKQIVKMQKLMKRNLGETKYETLELVGDNKNLIHLQESIDNLAKTKIFYLTKTNPILKDIGTFSIVERQKNIISNYINSKMNRIRIKNIKDRNFTPNIGLLINTYVNVVYELSDLNRQNFDESLPARYAKFFNLNTTKVELMRAVRRDIEKLVENDKIKPGSVPDFERALKDFNPSMVAAFGEKQKFQFELPKAGIISKLAIGEYKNIEALLIEPFIQILVRSKAYCSILIGNEEKDLSFIELAKMLSYQYTGAGFSIASIVYISKHIEQFAGAKILLKPMTPTQKITIKEEMIHNCPSSVSGIELSSLGITPDYRYIINELLSDSSIIKEVINNFINITSQTPYLSAENYKLVQQSFKQLNLDFNEVNWQGIVCIKYIPVFLNDVNFPKQLLEKHAWMLTVNNPYINLLAWLALLEVYTYGPIDLKKYEFYFLYCKKIINETIPAINFKDVVVSKIRSPYQINQENLNPFNLQSQVEEIKENVPEVDYIELNRRKNKAKDDEIKEMIRVRDGQKELTVKQKNNKIYGNTRSKSKEPNIKLFTKMSDIFDDDRNIKSDVRRAFFDTIYKTSSFKKGEIIPLLDHEVNVFLTKSKDSADSVSAIYGYGYTSPDHNIPVSIKGIIRFYTKEDFNDLGLKEFKEKKPEPNVYSENAFNKDKKKNNKSKSKDDKDKKYVDYVQGKVYKKGFAMDKPANKKFNNINTYVRHRLDLHCDIEKHSLYLDFLNRGIGIEVHEKDRKGIIRMWYTFKTKCIHCVFLLLEYENTDEMILRDHDGLNHKELKIDEDFSILTTDLKTMKMNYIYDMEYSYTNFKIKYNDMLLGNFTEWNYQYSVNVLTPLARVNTPYLFIIDQQVTVDKRGVPYSLDFMTSQAMLTAMEVDLENEGHIVYDFMLDMYDESERTKIFKKEYKLMKHITNDELNKIKQEYLYVFIGICRNSNGGIDFEKMIKNMHNYYVHLKDIAKKVKFRKNI